MRTIQSTGLKGLSVLALAVGLTGLAACAGTTTVYQTAPGGATPDDPASATDPNSPADPSTQGDPTSKDTPAPPLVTGLAITDVAFFQGVKVAVVKAGKVLDKSARNAPVVAGRPALVRVYVKPGSGYKAGEVVAQLRLVDGTTRLPVISDTKTLDSESTDEDTASTFNFEVPAESLPAGVTYQVLLTQKDGTIPTGSSDARFPADGGVQALDVEKSGTLKIVIVPVKYDFDGSGRVPDITAAQLAAYKKTFMSRYPATDVSVTARAPWSWTQRISGNGTGFDTVLNGVTQLRKTDGVAADVYYYGALAPTASFNSFCGGGCVTGLSTVVDSAKTSFLRASVGIGFSGDDSTNTAAHEVGHAHGRNHAPCGGAQGVDASFPYSTGGIGVWGYDILTKTFMSPSKGHDMMGYCPNEWVSDYTFSALFDRIAALNGGTPNASTGGTSGGAGSAQTFRMASVAGDGSVSVSSEITLDEAPEAGETRLATFVSSTGATLGTHTAHFYPYDHLPGGVLVVPSEPFVPGLAAKSRVTPWSTIKVTGVTTPIAR